MHEPHVLLAIARPAQTKVGTKSAWSHMKEKIQANCERGQRDNAHCSGQSPIIRHGRLLTDRACNRACRGKSNHAIGSPSWARSEISQEKPLAHLYHYFALLCRQLRRNDTYGMLADTIWYGLNHYCNAIRSVLSTKQ
jgi:hypothetical protein